MSTFDVVYCAGTKGVAKAMKEISAVAQKWEGKRWFTQLSDKRKLHPYQGNTVTKITGTTELYLVFSQRLV